MLMVALKVLLRVHAHMFEAMRKPRQESSGLAHWDIRQILQDQRKQVSLGADELPVKAHAIVLSQHGPQAASNDSLVHQHHGEKALSRSQSG